MPDSATNLNILKVDSYKEFGLVASIRTQVFVLEQECPAIEEFDDADNVAEHYLGYADNEPAIICRVLYPQENVAKIGRIATLKEFRGKGFASNLLKWVIAKLQNNENIDEIQMSAQEHAIGLYKKLGFQAYGESYIEDYLPHRMMSLKVKK